jgi:hypothetical protein
MLTPLGVMGGVRGTLFANVGGAHFDQTPFKAFRRDDSTERPVVGYVPDPTNPNLSQPVYGQEQLVSGFRLVDARASYGIGLQTFALGFPIHFDWSWRTLFNQGWEDIVFSQSGGSAAFRKPRFQVWIGYDF